jgi:DNA repair protein RadC
MGWPMRKNLGISISKVMLVRDQELPFERKQMRTPDDLFQLFAPLAAGMPVEGFWVAALDSGNHVLGISKLYQGTVSMSLVSAREVFQYLLLANASGFAVMHNHPSLEPFPSNPDKEMTRGLQAAAQTMQMRFLDHTIVAGARYFSFRREGLL